MEETKKVERETSRPTIRTLDLKLGEAVDFLVDPSFNRELPLQILCRSCGAHLHKDWRYERLTYRHDRQDWCQAPKLYAVTPHKILQAALRAVLEKAPAEPNETIYARLQKWVMYVNVEARSHDDCAIYVELNDPKDVRRCA